MSTKRYVLTLADQKAAQSANEKAGGGDGSHDYLKELSRSPLAVSELGRPRGYDHVHLSQSDGTPFVAWWGRAANGYHYRLGRWMELVSVADGHSSTQDKTP